MCRDRWQPGCHVVFVHGWHGGWCQWWPESGTSRSYCIFVFLTEFVVRVWLDKQSSVCWLSGIISFGDNVYRTEVDLDMVL